MKPVRILALGIGKMGKPLVQDLIKSDEVSEVVAADIDLQMLKKFAGSLESEKISVKKMDVTEHDKLVDLMKDGFDVVADTLNYVILRDYRIPVIEACIEAGVSHVDIVGMGWASDLDSAARDAGVTIIPGCGVDPGIDRILIGYGASRLDKVEKIHMYCGGFPQKNTSVFNNPLRYGITFTWTSVIRAPHGKARILVDGKYIDVDKLADPEIIEFPEPVGECEAFYLDSLEDILEALGLHDVRESWGKTVRWRGYCDMWKKLIDLKITSYDPLKVRGVEITPREFLIALGNKTLQYKEGEGDIVVERVEVIGEKGGERMEHSYNLIDLYDKETNTTAMGRTTSATCSIVSQMIGRGDITEKGVVHPGKIGFDEGLAKKFFSELARRNIHITETVTRPIIS